MGAGWRGCVFAPLSVHCSEWRASLLKCSYSFSTSMPHSAVWVWSSSPVATLADLFPQLRRRRLCNRFLTTLCFSHLHAPPSRSRSSCVWFHFLISKVFQAWADLDYGRSRTIRGTGFIPIGRNGDTAF